MRVVSDSSRPRIYWEYPVGKVFFQSNFWLLPRYSWGHPSPDLIPSPFGDRPRGGSNQRGPEENRACGKARGWIHLNPRLRPGNLLPLTPWPEGWSIRFSPYP